MPKLCTNGEVDAKVRNVLQKCRVPVQHQSSVKAGIPLGSDAGLSRTVEEQLVSLELPPSNSRHYDMLLDPSRWIANTENHQKGGSDVPSDWQVLYRTDGIAEPTSATSGSSPDRLVVPAEKRPRLQLSLIPPGPQIL